MTFHILALAAPVIELAIQGAIAVAPHQGCDQEDIQLAVGLEPAFLPGADDRATTAAVGVQRSAVPAPVLHQGGGVGHAIGGDATDIVFVATAHIYGRARRIGRQRDGGIQEYFARWTVADVVWLGRPRAHDAGQVPHRA